MRPIQSFVLVSTALLLSSVAGAQALIDVRAVAAADVFRSCEPTLLIVNNSPSRVDYLQIDVLVRLHNGREARVELKSGYRYGIARPIASGASGLLKRNPDEGALLGAACDEVVSLQAVASICESEAGDCTGAVALGVLPRRP